MSQRKAARAAQIEDLAQRLLALARAGDPKAIADQPGIGRAVALQVRDRIAADAEAWRAVVDALVAGLSHANARVRFECAHALDTYADPRARDALVPLIDDPVPRVRWMAMHALACDACKVEPPPFAQAVCDRIADRALADGSVQVRRHATAQLALCPPSLALETAEAILAAETDIAVRRNAAGVRRRLEAVP